MVSLPKQRLRDPNRNLLLHSPRQARHLHLLQRLPYSHKLVPPKWEHIQLVLQLPTRGVRVPLQREPTLPLVQTHVQDVALSRSLGLLSCPW